MITKIRKMKLFMLSAILASLMFNQTVNAACRSRIVWIENITDGTVRLHIFYLHSESDGVCVYQ
jgi:hypothetical protein